MPHEDHRPEFERLFVELHKRARGGRWEPNTDVFIDERGEHIVVQVELAGANPEHLRVGIDERHLFIRGRRADGARFRCGSFLQKEIEYGEFVKKLHLPVAVSCDAVTATYRAGMLTIELAVASDQEMPAARTEIHMTIRTALA